MTYEATDADLDAIAAEKVTQPVPVESTAELLRRLTKERNEARELLDIARKNELFANVELKKVLANQSTRLHNAEADRNEARAEVERLELAYAGVKAKHSALLAKVEALREQVLAGRQAAEDAAALRKAVEHWTEKTSEALASYGLANSKHHAELDRANRLEAMCDRLAERLVERDDTIAAQAKAIADVLALHTPTTRCHHRECDQCGFNWPCATYSAITPDAPASEATEQED